MNTHVSEGIVLKHESLSRLGGSVMYDYGYIAVCVTPRYVSFPSAVLPPTTKVRDFP